MRIPRKFALAAGAAGAVLLAGCSAQGQKKGGAGAPPTPVTVVEVQPRELPVYADFAAQTYVRNGVEVRGRVEGYIERWLFKPGGEVQAGQVLYVLDLRPYEAVLAQARGNLRQAEADLEFARHQVSLLQAEANLASARAGLVKARQDVERLGPLVKADAASQQDLDAASASLKANQANVDAGDATVKQTTLSTRTQIAAVEGRVEALRAAVATAELNLEYATIRAPIAGRVGDTLVPVGGLVTPSAPQPLTTIVPLDTIWVRFKVTEAEYLSWAGRARGSPVGGAPVTLVLADGSAFPQPGRIENTLNQVDARTGTLELQASFPNPRHALLPGQFGRVRVLAGRRTAVLAIPQRAVQQLQSMQTVYTLNAENKVAARPITTGDRSGDQWIVEKGLAPGDRVIVEGLLRVRPGVTVEPRPYQPSGAGK
jgi:membrane fusion protein (multidrug efflux system)